MQGVTRVYGAVTRRYRGLQGVTGGYGRLQGVGRSLRGLQEGTGGYKRLLEVTGG